ncbi:MAG: molybdenum cofactor guanylyltransferase [Desulfuromonadales bacterium]|nr:molybdenum cofactor guanylyltransferase [Desulfuromonadales bacterium]
MQISHNQQTSDHSDITGVILAGGHSRRMGRDKATLTLTGRTLFDRAHDALSGIFKRVLIAGDRPDLASETIPCFTDKYPGSALGGIHGGLCAARTPWIFVIPCDLAAPDPFLIRHLLPYRNGYEAVVPRTTKGFEPVFALYHKSCLPVMEQMLRAENYRIYDFYDRIHIRLVESCEMPIGWERSMTNLNSPADLALLTREVQ